MPTLPPLDEAGADGAPQLDPIEEAMKIVEAEKEKANEFAEELKIQKEKEASPYNRDRDYCF